MIGEAVRGWIEGIPAFWEQPVSYLITVACLLCLAPAVKSQLHAWRQDWLLRSLPKAPGCIPFLSHSLALLCASPWVLTEKWVREHKGKLVRMQVCGCCLDTCALIRYASIMLQCRPHYR